MPTKPTPTVDIYAVDWNALDPKILVVATDFDGTRTGAATRLRILSGRWRTYEASSTELPPLSLPSGHPWRTSLRIRPGAKPREENWGESKRYLQKEE